jgi:hypothetical protein
LKHKKVAVKNLRIVASMLYFIARALDPQLPNVAVEQKVVIKKEPPPHVSPEKVVPVGETDKVIVEVKDVKPSGEKKSTRIYESTLLYIISFFTGRKEALTNHGDINHAYAESTILGNKRPAFDTLQNLHNFLLPIEYFTSKEANREVFEQICKEMRSKLNLWLTRMCIVGITYKLTPPDTIPRPGDSRLTSRPEKVLEKPLTSNAATKDASLTARRKEAPSSSGGAKKVTPR